MFRENFEHSCDQVVSERYFSKKYQNSDGNHSVVILPVCFYHVTFAFQSEPTLHSCLNVKDLLARNRRNIWNLSDWNETRTNNHLVRKRTLNHFVYELSGCGFESRCFLTDSSKQKVTMKAQNIMTSSYPLKVNSTQTNRVLFSSCLAHRV